MCRDAESSSGRTRRPTPERACVDAFLTKHDQSVVAYDTIESILAQPDVHTEHVDIRPAVTKKTTVRRVVTFDGEDNEINQTSRPAMLAGARVQRRCGERRRGRPVGRRRPAANGRPFYGLTAAEYGRFARDSRDKKRAERRRATDHDHRADRVGNGKRPQRCLDAGMECT